MNVPDRYDGRKKDEETQHVDIPKATETIERYQH